MYCHLNGVVGVFIITNWYVTVQFKRELASVSEGEFSHATHRFTAAHRYFDIKYHVV